MNDLLIVVAFFLMVFAPCVLAFLSHRDEPATDPEPAPTGDKRLPAAHSPIVR
jgi:hypothetical protein